MPAVLVEKPRAAGAVAPGDQVLAQQAKPLRGTVALEFAREQCRDPVAPHQLTERRAGPGVGKDFVVFAVHALRPFRIPVSAGSWPGRPATGPATAGIRYCTGRRPRAPPA